MREDQRAPLILPATDSPAIVARAAPDDSISLAFDYGTRRIGVAVGNGITRTARPLAVVRSASVDTPALWRELGALVVQWQPRQLVVGIARHPDGADHAMTARCERFARQLEGRFHLPVARVDERYSTAVLEPGSATDDQAAAVILQQWFDAAPNTAPAPAGGATAC